MKLTRESGQQMEEGIRLVLSRWRELRDAVEVLWGGPHSHELANNFVNQVVDIFLCPNGGEPPCIYDLEDLLDKGMDSLSLEEVQSIKEVARILMDMYEECLENNYQRIQKLRDTAPLFQTTSRPRKAASISVAVDEDYRNSSIIDNSSESLPNQEGTSQAVELDEAPWITVTSKKVKGLKKTRLV
ncbi:hypothetical protein RND81_09G056600 [Saponaria officinalis]|uniref:Pre-rRNA-processing protein TSR2 homolog n=1 Tax=Saponaria officinalis TaxID=3572 RepID=A0AAW1IHZ5_SAPOF